MSPKKREKTPLITRATGQEELRGMLLGKPGPRGRPAPLQHLIAFGVITPDESQVTPQEVVDHLFDTPLEELVTQVAQAYRDRSHLPPEQIESDFEKLRTSLKQKVREVMTDEETHQTYTQLLDRVMGETTLREYYGSNAANHAQWCTAIEEALLIMRAQQGDHEAFKELYARHEKEVKGFIRVRTDNDEDAQDVAQETWSQVWPKMPTYDPARAYFQDFAKFWASIMMLRHYAAEEKRRKVEVLFSELLSRFPDLEQEEDIVSMIERLRALPVPPEEEIPPEVYTELLRITFGGSSPPHQLIAFGFVKLVEWTPREIVAKLSDTPLRKLERQLEKAYLEKSSLPEDGVTSRFTQLRENMDRRFEEVAKDPNTLKTYQRLLKCIVGDTTLQSYYTGSTSADHAADISHWWEAIRRRVRSEILQIFSQGRGPLVAWLQGVRRRAARKASRPRKDNGGHRDV